MTAINVVIQKRHSCLHICSDAAVYTADGVVQFFRSKALPIRSWPGAITGTGPTAFIDYAKDELESRFENFDDVVAGAEAALAEIANGAFSLGNGDLIIAGWSESRQQCESYAIWPVAGEFLNAEDAGKLRRLPNVVTSPGQTLAINCDELCLASGWPGINPEDDPQRVVEALNMLVEIQRQSVFQNEDSCFVGGWCEVVSVTSDSVQKRTLAKWHDKEGELIKPGKMDWAKWRAEHMPLHNAAAIPAGLSRLQRERMAKKARKRTFRAA